MENNNKSKFTNFLVELSAAAIIFVAVAIAVIIHITGFTVKSKTNKVYIEREVDTSNFDLLDSTNSKTINVGEVFSEDSLSSLLEEINIQHPEIVMAQAKLESGNFTSDLFIKNNNMFGMKQPAQRVTLSVGAKNGYSNYRTWEDSVIDYAIFQSSYLRNLSKNAYFDYLRKNYANDSSYIRKLKAIIEEDKNNLN